MERQPFDTYRPHLFPRLSRVADVVGKLSFLPQTPISRGDHVAKPKPTAREALAAAIDQVEAEHEHQV